MMVIFVSQCEKNAIPKTRRILDAFANRIGDNVWQTLITEAGLNAVYKLLRRGASRNTAVSCHWLRSRTRRQLLWVVGNKKKFNFEGYVPVNRTEIANNFDDSTMNWKYLPLIKAFSSLASLFHDWGKSSVLFQEKLKPTKKKVKGDPIRHEWVSIELLTCLFLQWEKSKKIESDIDWITALKTQEINEKDIRSEIVKLESIPWKKFPDAFSLLLWLVLSHHRLPFPDDEKERQKFCTRTNDRIQTLLNRISKEWGYENKAKESDYSKRLSKCHQFPKERITDSAVWQREVKYWASVLERELPLFNQTMQDGSWRAIVYFSKLCLMLGDHNYSSSQADPEWNSPINQLYANSCWINGENRLNQKLDEHLVNVGKAAVKVAEALPFFEKQLPTVDSLSALKPQKNTPKKFLWQDNAVESIRKWTNDSEDDISFVINMASTGCGKTLGNAKIMQAISREQLRYILALGLRSLTLQTGNEYRRKIGLDESQLAVLIGSQALVDLFNTDSAKKENTTKKDVEENIFEENGSESITPIEDSNLTLDFKGGDITDETCKTILKTVKNKKFFYAPILTCTIDHLMPVAESTRGGSDILPVLRLLSSDLVIDEIDDFVGKDLIAISRLVYLTGFFGRKLMISSATIPPDLALGFFYSYMQGYRIYTLSHGVSSRVNCAWVDEFKTEIRSFNFESEFSQFFEKQHSLFIEKRVANLEKQKAKRKGYIALCAKENTNETLEEQYFSHIKSAITRLHSLNFRTDEKTGKKVSFGVVRVANIAPCVQLTRYLMGTHWDPDTDIRCMAYHARQVLLLRHAQEKYLDEVLGSANNGNPCNHSTIRKYLDTCSASNMIFILVATPVEEVGRDHDFDWAVVEPSSYRSIIQLAGRVRRHRNEEVNRLNMAIMQYNLKGFKNTDDYAFHRPGYEIDKDTKLDTHNVSELLNEGMLEKNIDAIPRISKKSSLQHKTSLIDLEHFATARTFSTEVILEKVIESDDFKPNNPSTILGYSNEYWWMTALPQYFNRFREGDANDKLYLLYENEQIVFCEYDQRSQKWSPVEKVRKIRREDFSSELKNRLWFERNYLELLQEYSNEGQTFEDVSQRYGEMSIARRLNEKNFVYDDQFGLIVE